MFFKKNRWWDIFFSLLNLFGFFFFKISLLYLFLQWQEIQNFDDNPATYFLYLELRKLEQKSQFNEVSSESVRPLLVLLDNEVKKPVESINNFLRPTTSPVKKHLTDQEGQNPLSTIFTEHSINSNNPIQSQKSVSSTNSFLPSIKSSGSRKLEPVKLIPSTTTQATSNVDTLYQTAYKSIEKPRKLLDKEFSTQHRAVKATIRPTGLVN